MPLPDISSLLSLFSGGFSLPALLIVALLGMVLGSFVTMASYRLPRGEDVVFKRSHCPHCSHSLHCRDLIPVFSWLATRGKCRYCHVPISARYPLIELALALLFCLVYSQFGLSILSLLLLLVTVCLMVIIVTDLEHYIIPDKIQIIMVLLAFTYGMLTGMPLLTMLTGALVGGATGLALRYICTVWKKREALGWGDVKFLAVSGLYLGVIALPVFFFISGVAGIITGLLWQISGRGKQFPFAPALVVALFLLLIFPGINYRLYQYFIAYYQ